MKSVLPAVSPSSAHSWADKGVEIFLRQWLPWLRPIPWQWMLLTLVPLLLDGVTHALSDMIYGIGGGGFRDTNLWLVYFTGNAGSGFYAGDHLGTFNWWLRLLTGALAAWGIAFYVFPWLGTIFDRELRRHRRQAHQTHHDRATP